MFELSDYEEIRERLLDNDKPGAALKEFEAILEEEPENPMVLFGKGHALTNLYRYDEAIETFEKAIDLDPQNTSHWRGLGHALYSSHKLSQAVQAFEKSIELNPEDAFSWKGKGNALYTLGDYTKAIIAYENAIDLDPNSANSWKGKGNALYTLGDYVKAIKAYDTAIDLNPNSAHSWNGKGNALQSLGLHSEALLAFNKALVYDNESAPAWNGKGNALHSLRIFSKAKIAFEKAILFEPDLAPAWNGKGNALLFLRLHSEALTAFEKAIEFDSELAPAWNGKGNALQSLGSHIEAIKAYQMATEINPLGFYPWLNLSLAEAYGTPNRQRSFCKAITIANNLQLPLLFKNAYHLIPIFGGIRLSERLIKKFHLYDSISFMGFCHEIQQKCKLTDPIIRATQDKNPFAIQDLDYWKGIIYHIEGDPEMASGFFDVVLDQEEDRLDAWFYLIQSQYGYHADFLPDLEKAIEVAKEYEEYRLENNYGYNLYYAGHILLFNQEYKQALAYFDRALAVLQEHDLAFLPALYMQLICHQQISHQVWVSILKQVASADLKRDEEVGPNEKSIWTPAMEAIASEITEAEREQLLVGKGYLHGVEAVEFTLDQAQFKNNLFRYVHFHEIILGVQLMWEHLTEMEDGLVMGTPYPELYTPDKVWHLPQETLNHLEKVDSEQVSRRTEELRTQLGRDFVAVFDAYAPDQVEVQIVKQIKTHPRDLSSHLDLIAYCFWQHSLSKRTMVLLAYYALFNHKAQGKNWEALESEFQKFVRANLVSQGSSVGIALGSGVGTVAGPTGSIVGGILGSVLGKWIWEEIKPAPEIPDYLDFKQDFAQHVLALQMDERYAGWMDFLVV